MGRLRMVIDAWFERFAWKCINHKKMIILVVVLLTGFMVMQLPKITFDMSNEAFLHKTDPSILMYNQFREQFGRDEMIVIMLKPANIFDLRFLENLKKFHHELQDNVPHLNDITSLVNARITKGAEGELRVEELLDRFPESAEDLAELKSSVLSNPMYTNLLISEDGSLTTVLIKSDAYSSEPSSETSAGNTLSDVVTDDGFAGNNNKRLLTNEENAALVAAVREIIAKYNTPDFPVYLSGSPVVTDFLKQTMQKDMGKFTLLAILGIAVFLFIFFRRLSGVVLPLTTVLLSVVYTFALMSLTKTPVKVPLVILPSFLLATGIGASVHFMTIFFQTFKQGNKREAISKTLAHSGLPIVMTSLTTAAGLLSFVQATLAPAADLGIFAAAGVTISLVFTIVLVPALISLFPIKPLNRQSSNQKSLVVKSLIRIGKAAVDYRWLVLGVTVVIFIISAFGIMRLSITHHVLLWFPKGSEIRDNTELIDSKMKGTLAIEVILDTKKENGLYDPAFLNRLEQLSKRVMAYSPRIQGMFIGKTISLVDLLKEINQALNENKPEFYSIPQDRTLVAQELFLFENSGSDDLKDMVDSQFSKTHLTIKVPWNDSVSYLDFFQFLDRNLEELFGNEVDIHVTGVTEMLMKTAYAMMKSTLQSYGIALVLISLMMVLLLGKLKIGLLSMVPNVTPIVLTLGLMGWFGINLDMFSMLIGSIAIGLAVDDTIHFFHNFKKHFDATGNVHAAVENTLASTGVAMLTTSLVLVTGFWLFMFATLQNLFLFGFLTGITLIFAFLADIVLSPALLAIVTKNR